MSRKIILALTGFIIFLACFTASVKVRDYFYEQSLRTNIKLIKVGMSEAEVIGILGEPTDKQMSDIPGRYWCYETDTFARALDDTQNRLGRLLLQMSRDGKVVKSLTRTTKTNVCFSPDTFLPAA